ncbi:hypothetical protein [Microcoleus sp. D2_18a_D3]|uniref:hypothetical protein n=1 Tax=Microcoleus sp. D2_18a_D3 TaxID=3055330 RepID=UPI002FD45FF4
MGQMGKGIKVNALVDALNRYQPEQLDKLRQQYPEQSELLALGQLMGEVNPDTILVAKLAIMTLRAIKTPGRNILNRLRRRLRRARKIRLMGNIVTAISSAGLISAVLVESKGAAIASALINLVSSVSLLISQHLESSSLGNQNGLQELFDQLVEAVVDIEDLESKLTVALKTQDNEDELLRLAQEANALVAQVRKVELIIGS